MLEGKINWGEKEEGTKEIPKVKPEQSKVKGSIEQIEKLKKDILKDINNTIKNCDKLYEVEKTNTLSSIQIILSLLQREINKL